MELTKRQRVEIAFRHEEAAQVAWFLRRGLHVQIGNM